MGRIPIVQNQVSASSAGNRGQIPFIRGINVSANSFGMQGARNLASLAGGLNDLGSGLSRVRDRDLREKERAELKVERELEREQLKKERAAEREQRKTEREAERELDRQAGRDRRQTIANTVAQSDFTPVELALRTSVSADGSGYRELVLEQFDEFVETRANEIEDDEARQEYEIRMSQQRTALSARAARYEAGARENFSMAQADQSLTTLDNRIRTNPMEYDALVGQGMAVIDAQTTLPESARIAMKDQFRESAAISMFEGRIGSAVSVEEIEDIRDELANPEVGRDWSGELSAQGLERALGLANSALKHRTTEADAQARAALSKLEERSADPTTLIPDEELQRAQALVGASNNAVTQARLARIVRNQGIIKGARKLTPQQQAGVISGKQLNELPPRVGNAVLAASSAFGVSSAYLAATVQREYGQHLKGDPDEIDYGKGNAAGASSATGIIQAVDATWLRLIKKPRVTSAAGISTAGMSDEQLLKLRANPEVSLMVGAAYAAENRDAIRRRVGREPSEAELYMAHFLGAGGPKQAGATDLLIAVRDQPDADAVKMFPKAAAANPSIFKSNGRNRDVREVYNELARKHTTDASSETYRAYQDRQVQEDILEHTQKRLSDDPMRFADEVGVLPLNDLFGEEGFKQRGVNAAQVADYYNIPPSQIKPFTDDEANELSNQFRTSDAASSIRMVREIHSMGPEMADAALNQLSVKDPVYAYAGGLSMHTGSMATATDVIRGFRRMEENPDIKNLIGMTDPELSNRFSIETDGALLGADPSQRQNIIQAAKAHYVETHVARSGGGFDGDKFRESISAVLGGTAEAPALDEVNGYTTLMPRGVTSDTMETAIELMEPSQWASMSVHGDVPRYGDGTPVDTVADADDFVFRSVGGGQYKVYSPSGDVIVTGEGGRMRPFMFRPTPDGLRSAIGAKVDAERERLEALRAEQRRKAGVE